MSATNRGGERSEADFYRSPQWAVHRFLERCPLPGGRWLELGAGEGDIIRAVNGFGDHGMGARWTAVELREQCRPMLEREAERVLIGNAIGATRSWLGACPKFDVCCSNPPFRWALEFIHVALKFAHVVAFLLRLDFLATADRAPFMQRFPPDVYVIPDRISFTGDGQSDSTDHAWFVWNKQRVRRAGRLLVLDTTPQRVRKAQMLLPMEVPAVVQQEMFG